MLVCSGSNKMVCFALRCAALRVGYGMSRIMSAERTDRLWHEKSSHALNGPSSMTSHFPSLPSRPVNHSGNLGNHREAGSVPRKLHEEPFYISVVFRFLPDAMPRHAVPSTVTVHLTASDAGYASGKREEGGGRSGGERPSTASSLFVRPSVRPSVHQTASMI